MHAALGCAKLASMNVALRKPMTLPQFLAWEERQELRYEFDGFQPVEIPDVTVAQDMIGNALRALLADSLRGTPCRVHGPTLKIEVMGRIRYPDAFVCCTPTPSTETVIKDPVVVLEVLSASASCTEGPRGCLATRRRRRSKVTSS